MTLTNVKAHKQYIQTFTHVIALLTATNMFYDCVSIQYVFSLTPRDSTHLTLESEFNLLHFNTALCSVNVRLKSREVLLQLQKRSVIYL